jgi:choline dehydrogenase-like flavoprotein
MAPSSLQRLFPSQRVVAMPNPQPIIVVGAGTAGCTVVSYLAHNTAHPILVLEPGGYGNDDDSRFLNLSDTDLLVATHDGYVQARAMGGGSAVNGMLLTGEEPDHLRGLTRLAQQEDIGLVGEELIAVGGRFSRLWWNNGRWNPARALRHLIDGNRVSHLPRNATKLIHDKGRVIGVDCGDEFLQTAAVVLCAGAIVSPGILLESGLEKLNPAIGRGLQNHPTVTAQFSLTAPQSARFDAAVVREWSTASGGQMLNVAYERVAKNQDDEGALSVSLMNPMSRGRVELSLNKGLTADFRYLEAEEDMSHMVMGVRDLVALLTDGNFSGVPESITVEGRPIDELRGSDDAELARWLHQSVTGVSHASSSCAQAVDSLGRVQGVENCWIADASVLPRVPSVTPAAPVTMEAVRIARNIGESLS